MKKKIIFLHLLLIVFIFGIAFFSMYKTSSIHHVYDEIEFPKDPVSFFPSEVSVTFSGYKKIEGIDETDGVFTFALYETEQDYHISDLENPLLTTTTSGKIIGQSPYAFDSIVYKEPGIHYYVIRELRNTSSFVTDERNYKMKVSVTQIDSELAIEVVGDVSNNQLNFSSKFMEETKENPYTRNPIRIILLIVFGIIFITIVIEVGIRFHRLKESSQDDLKDYEK